MGKLITPKRKLAATAIIFIFSIVMTASCLGVGAYFAKLYWDFIRDAFHSTEKPLLTESTTCSVLNAVESCRIVSGQQVESNLIDIKYCHLSVSYHYGEHTYSNTTLDDFAKMYRLTAQNETDWIELTNEQFGLGKVFTSGNTSTCFTSKEYPSWFIGIGERTFLYYYNNVESFLTSSSIIAVATLIPAACLLLFVLIPSLACLVYQCRRMKKLLPENLVGEQHFKHQTIGGGEDDSDEDDDHHVKKNKNYF